MATITLFIEEADESEERRQRTRKRRAAGVLIIAIAAALAFAPKSETKLQDVIVIRETPRDEPDSSLYPTPIGPMPDDRQRIVTVIERRPPVEPEKPIIVSVTDPLPAWPSLPGVTRIVETREGGTATETHACSMNPRVEPRHLHFTAPGRKQVTISNPHDVALRVDRIDLAGSDGTVRGYTLEGERACVGELQPDARCTFIVRATSVAAYTPSVRVDIGHATRK